MVHSAPHPLHMAGAGDAGVEQRRPRAGVSPTRGAGIGSVGKETYFLTIQDCDVQWRIQESDDVYAHFRDNE